MINRILGILALAMLFSGPLRAQEIVGDWQGTFGAGKGFRIVVQIRKGDSGGWKATLYSIDVGPDGAPANSVALQGRNLRLAFDAMGSAYEGTVNADGSSIQGTWTQNKAASPLNFQRATKETAWPLDPSPHSVQLITVDEDVKLEVLDWGGSGRPLVLLAGLGNTAHIFDRLAPKLTPAYHVYGITRRGFGASSAPVPRDENYSADRLGDDVLAVIDALKLKHPVLVGHSIAGEELSSVGSRHPEKVAGLVYLDAGYAYAYYDRSHGDFNLDSIELQKKLAQLRPGNQPPDARPLVQETLETSLPQFERDLQKYQKELQAMPPSTFAVHAAQTPAPVPAISEAIVAGERKYTSVPVPILAIFAVPHESAAAAGNDAAAKAALEARDEVTMAEITEAFESGLPSARVVRLPHASHFIFVSNEADVLREMNAFLASLP
jgi:non-heme chloroperoxidase